jgi:predicted amidophosphoribosyltransferase
MTYGNSGSFGTVTIQFSGSGMSVSAPPPPTCCKCSARATRQLDEDGRLFCEECLEDLSPGLDILCSRTRLNGPEYWRTRS